MSAATITKRIGDLRAGDVILRPDGNRISIVQLGSVTIDGGEARIEVHAVVLTYKRPPVVTTFTLAGEVQVEAPALTPAQQHAEEMVELLRRIMARVDDPRKLIPQEIKMLLEKIDPPAPPTLEEALRLIAALRNSGDDAAGLKLDRDAAAMLDRARRAGVLKEHAPGGYAEGAQRVIDALSGKKP